MNQILIQFAHPAKSRSRMNSALLDAIEDLEGVTVNDLYAHYPDFLIDIKREQTLCEDHAIIIFQHPFYWYSTPSIMKEWLDLVLQHGWAYGSVGRALHGKYFLQAITAGGDDGTYQKEGYNGFTIRELLAPYQATAKLCGMVWLPPFAVLGIHRGVADDRVRAHAEAYRHALIALREGAFDIEKASEANYLNAILTPKNLED